ncbi:MAG: hypothetical protein JWQ11_1645, partial [Rhizobacter sp.]|nr:hypothetical protein [Rhizobacter sp.]
MAVIVYGRIAMRERPLALLHQRLHHQPR